MMGKSTCDWCSNIAVSNVEIHHKQGNFSIYHRGFCYKHLQEYWNIFGYKAISGDITWLENRLDRGNNGDTHVL